MAEQYLFDLGSAKLMANYARVITAAMFRARRSVGGSYRPGDHIALVFDRPMIGLAEIIYADLIRRGFQVALKLLPTPSMERSYYANAGRPQLMFLPAWEKLRYERLNGQIALFCPESLDHLKNADPAKKALVARTLKPLLSIREEREKKGAFGWTLAMGGSPALARAAGFSLKAYNREIARACFLDARDPVGRWRQAEAGLAKAKKWLDRLPVDSLHIRSRGGTDLKVGLGRQRRWIAGTGHNVPSFEIFTSPDARATEGIFSADVPSFRQGQIIRHVTLEFRKGEVVKAAARQGGRSLMAILKTDRGARRLGEVSMTDKRFSRISRFMANTLFDENIGGRNGNCHIALGKSFPAEAVRGRPNKKTLPALGCNDSAIHWDLIDATPKTITARLNNGREKLIYENGRLKIKL